MGRCILGQPRAIGEPEGHAQMPRTNLSLRRPYYTKRTE